MINDMENRIDFKTTNINVFEEQAVPAKLTWLQMCCCLSDGLQRANQPLSNTMQQLARRVLACTARTRFRQTFRLLLATCPLRTTSRCFSLPCRMFFFIGLPLRLSSWRFATRFRLSLCAQANAGFGLLQNIVGSDESNVLSGITPGASPLTLPPKNQLIRFFIAAGAGFEPTSPDDPVSSPKDEPASRVYNASSVCRASLDSHL